MNYYELLGVSSTASSEEIKKAYKIQMKKWHPDINKDDEAVTMSIKLNEAKTTLLDDAKRREYDDYLKYKGSSTYQKYATRYGQRTNSNYQEYETKTVTKWDYFKEYLHNDNVKFINKIISFVLVMLESLFCFTLKWLIIFLAFVSFFLSDIIITILYYLFPILVLLVVFVIYLVVTKNGSVSYATELKSLFVIAIVYLSSYLFAFLGKKLISQKVFEFLYNKLDIYLFKKAVGYK